MTTLNDVLTLVDIDCPINLFMFRGVDHEYISYSNVWVFREKIIEDINDGILKGNAQVIKLDAGGDGLYIEILI